MTYHQKQLEKAIGKLSKIFKTKYIGFAIEAQSAMFKAVSSIILEKKFNTGRLYKSLRKKPLWKSGALIKVQVITDKRIAPYGGVIHDGRLPGKWPNINKIKRYLISKGEPAETLDRAAFLVGRKIKRDGIPPFPFMKLGQDKATPKIRELAAKYGMKFT